MKHNEHTAQNTGVGGDYQEPGSREPIPHPSDPGDWDEALKVLVEEETLVTV